MIRRAKPGDAAAIAALEKARPTAPGWTAAQAEQEAGRADSVFLVQETDGALEGHAAFRTELEEAHLLTIAVRPDAVRRGIGRALLESLVIEAERLGLSKMTLEVEHGNAAALALYASAGFEEVGRRKAFYGPGRDAVLMDKLL